MKNNLTDKRGFCIKKKSAAIIAMFLILSVAGVVCYFVLKAPKPVTAEIFSGIMRDNGFAVTDRMGDDGIDPNINKAVIVAVKDDLYLQYRSFEDSEQAKIFYDDNSSAYVDQYTGELNRIGDKEYESIRLKSDMGRYFVVSRIDNTVIVAETYNAFIDEMNDIFEKLGY
jgi:hypothetical protein